MTTATEMTITGLAPWFGSNRSLAHTVGALMGDVPFVAVAFAGSMCEIPHFKASSLLVNDLHADLITLARVVADDALRAKLKSRLERKLVHVHELDAAQKFMRDRRGIGLFGGGDHVQPEGILAIAEAYFTCVWMTRSGVAGTDGELSGGLTVRYDAGGGGSAKRYFSAVDSLDAWSRELKRCEFLCEDFEEFIRRVPDAPHRTGDADCPPRGIYCDPPFPGPGDAYANKLTVQQQRRLARLVTGKRHTRVVMRFYDHPLVQELYPEGQWRWARPEGGRDQHNADKPEVLLWNGV
ncbi:MAG: hypothetical protein AMXMBFR58_29430 [Phycisphaerae bacterium]